MQKIDTQEPMNDEDREKLFVSVVSNYIEQLNLPSFSNEGLTLARSEKEIAKCHILKQKAAQRKDLKAKRLEKDTENKTSGEPKNRERNTRGNKHKKDNTFERNKKSIGKKENFKAGNTKSKGQFNKGKKGKFVKNSNK